MEKNGNEQKVNGNLFAKEFLENLAAIDLIDPQQGS